MSNGTGSPTPPAGWQPGAATPSLKEYLLSAAEIAVCPECLDVLVFDVDVKGRTIEYCYTCDTLKIHDPREIS